ncbi:DNA replication/repair protein RecF [Candidatus Foliamicus sp.]
MARLTQLRVRNYRAVKALELVPDERGNLVSGHNGAGKTSLLESIFLLSRGRGFRGGDVRQLIRHGQEAARVSGTVAGEGGVHELTVTIEGRAVLSSLDGETGARRAALARALPVLNLDARVMDLVDRGPERRRQLLNWVTFHVEPSFHAAWRRFRRSLRQRNAGLRAAAGVVTAWDKQFCAEAEAMEGQRRAIAERLRPRFRRIAEQLLGLRVDWNYLRGWPRDRTLREALRESLDGDRKLGMTRLGPQRADIALRLESERARYVASRGQQKLLAAAMILAAAELLVEAGVAKPVVLADEPLVELDAEHANRLLQAMTGVQAQLFITAVETAPFTHDFKRSEFRLDAGALV